ncbi:MAG: FmdE family protein [bacterium]|nr:FmdE family protein [bacterium]
MENIIKIAADPAIEAMAERTIARWGKEEWRAVILTNEIHGHIGIYSTIGAKMGIYALEFISRCCNKMENLKVLSFAGSRPPISCFNDGLQISTGATLGHGSIKIAKSCSLSKGCKECADCEELIECADARVEAIFRFKAISGTEAKEMQLRVWLKEELRQQIAGDIANAVKQYGHTPDYWLQVRRLALDYWQQWNRAEIFETEAQRGQRTAKLRRKYNY